MIRQLIIYFTLLLSACAQKDPMKDRDKVHHGTPYSADSTQSFSIIKASTADFTKAKKNFRDKLVQDTLTIKKVNGVTELPLIKPHYPPSVIFTDTLSGTGETDEREYHYLGHFPDLGKYLVSGTFWEHSACYLIDKKTGNQTTTWNRPYLSPNSQFLGNLSMSYGLEGTPNGIQIWKVEAQNHLSSYLDLNQQIWVPDDFVWESDNSLILRVTSVGSFLDSNGQPNEKDFYYLRLRLK